MDWNTYQKEAFKTNAKLGDNLQDNLHMILGMLTEVGELADVFKKHIAYKTDVDWVNVKEELADLMWYVAGFCEFNNIDLENVLDRNIRKLRARYPDGFKENDAVHRDLNKERKILEGTSKIENIDDQL